MLSQIQELLSGKKSYLVSLGLIVFGVSGVISHNMTSEQAITLVLNGLGLGSIRAGIAKK